ncbi:hypothetical protein Hanom_Chr03g00236391 [Helianthus anomalus]
MYFFFFATSKWNPVRYRIYRTGYIFDATFDIFGTSLVPVFTGFYPQIPVPYRDSVPTFGDFRYRYFRFRYRLGTELIPTTSVMLSNQKRIGLERRSTRGCKTSYI